MLGPNPKCEGFGFNENALLVQQAKNVPGGMPRRQQHRLGAELFPCLAANTDGSPLFHEHLGHTRPEAHFSPMLADGLAHLLDDFGKLVGTNMRMSVHQNIRARPKGYEQIHHALNVPTLLRTGVEFSVRIGSRPAFSKAVVAIRVDFMVDGDGLEVSAAALDILAALDDDRLDPQLNKL